jgi:hypothetical protein
MAGGFSQQSILRSKSMKITILKIVATIVFLVASGATAVKADGGGEPPLCFPKACPAQ